MTTRILVELDFIRVATLLPPVPVVVFADVVERHFERVGAHAEVGVGHLLAYGIHVLVELELHAKALADVVHQVSHATLETRFVCLTHACCRGGSQHE